MLIPLDINEMQKNAHCRSHLFAEHDQRFRQSGFFFFHSFLFKIFQFWRILFDCEKTFTVDLSVG